MKKILNTLKKEFRKEILDVKEHNKRRAYIRINKESLLKVAGYLYNDLKFRFATASGSDLKEGFEIIYHFSDDRKTGSMINIRVLLDNKKPKVESLVPIFAGAEWVEREMHEMLGIDFKNHPNLVPFLLPEDWPKGKYPLRKDHKK